MVKLGRISYVNMAPVFYRVDAEVDEVRSGTVSVTEDLHFILDKVPGLKGLYVMTGCQEAGITHD